MIMLDSTTAVIYDTDDLDEAVSSNNGINLVYFGASFTLTRGVTIHPDKGAITFDGTFEGTTYTFTDYNNSSSTTTLGIRVPTNIEITFRNINLVGRNFYGIPYVPNSSPYTGVSTLYESVSYTGTQMVHNPYGFTRLTDCNLTINNQEAGEVSRLEICGSTTITKTNTGNAVFWFYGTDATPSYLRVMPGADFTVTTENYFAYETFPPAIIVDTGATFTLDTVRGISDTSSHTIASFLVDEGAVFRFTQSANGGNSTMYLDGALTVNAGAEFYMQADFSSSHRLIHYTGSSGGLYLNNPRSFVVYNLGNSSVNAIYFTAQIPFEITGGQLNFWITPKAFPEAGTFGDKPLHKWMRPSREVFTLRGTASSSLTNVTYHDFTDEELAELPPLGDLQLDEAKVLSAGNLPLEVYSTVLTRSVTGSTGPFANVKIVLIPEYYEDPHTTVADSEGLFGITPTSPVRYSNQVEVQSNTPFLIVSDTRAVNQQNILEITDATSSIGFVTPPLDGFEGVFLRRAETAAYVEVLDTRDDKTLDWRLWAKVTGPLMTEDGYTLDNAAVFVLPDDEIATLGTEYIPVHRDNTGQDDTKKVTWEEAYGVLARITTPIMSGKRYTTKLHWIVLPENEEPEVENG